MFTRMRLIAWPITDVGRVRSANEDAYLVNDAIGLYLVADGMGGHAGGAHASQTCVDVVNRVVARGLSGKLALPRDAATAAFSELLGQAASEASARIFDRGMQDPELQGMGTTLTGIFFHRDKAHIVHIGDSRCYLLRGGTVRQLTNDHSWLNEQVQAGLMTEAEAAMSDLRHIITRSVGFEREIEADLLSFNVQLGDVFLLCSDGLSNYLETDEIGEIARNSFYDELAPKCVQVALDRGGDDNITAVAVMLCNDRDQRRMARPDRETVADTIDH
jgi:protein phosphatase